MMKITQTMMFAAQGHDAQGARLRVAAEYAPIRGPQIGSSMDPPQLRQITLAVSDMRAIVECAPQLVHAERSSNRRRQLTQR
jgi:hypothetical protein